MNLGWQRMDIVRIGSVENPRIKHIGEIEALLTVRIWHPGFWLFVLRCWLRTRPWVRDVKAFFHV